MSNPTSASAGTAAPMPATISNASQRSVPPLPFVPPMEDIMRAQQAIKQPPPMSLSDLLRIRGGMGTGFMGRVGPDNVMLGEAAFWTRSRDQLSDSEKARIEGIDNLLNLLDDPAWYHWPTWQEAVDSGKYGTEEQMRSTIPAIQNATGDQIKEIYRPAQLQVQEDVKNLYPLKRKYSIALIDRHLKNLDRLSSHASIPLVYLVGEEDGTTNTVATHQYSRTHNRYPKVQDTYRHIMFPINRYDWLQRLPYIIPEAHLGGFMDHPPLKGFIDSGIFNSFLKPGIECQPLVGKPAKVTVSFPILCLMPGAKLRIQKTAERLIAQYPKVLRAPGYQYQDEYYTDGGLKKKPPIWNWTQPFDRATGENRDEPHDIRGPPIVYSARSLFEYRYPRRNTAFLDGRQTTRRGNNTMENFDTDKFIMVEQLWAVIIPKRYTLITFQGLISHDHAAIGGNRSTHMFQPGKAIDITPQGALHGFLILFADMVLITQYELINTFRNANATLSFRVSNNAMQDDELIQDFNIILQEISIIIDITGTQLGLLQGVKDSLFDDELVGPDEYLAVESFFKLLTERLVVVISQFRDQQTEVKQAQTLLFQLLLTDTAKNQSKMSAQQALIAEQTAEETKVQLALSVKASEQGKSFMVFTIITTVFLPLSFFTSYFGMNTIDIRDMGRKQPDFWKVAGPSSTIIVVVVMGWAFRIQLMRTFWTIIGNKSKASGVEGGGNDPSTLEKGMHAGQGPKGRNWFGLNRSHKID